MTETTIDNLIFTAVLIAVAVLSGVVTWGLLSSGSSADPKLAQCVINECGVLPNAIEGKESQ